MDALILTVENTFSAIYQNTWLSLLWILFLLAGLLKLYNIWTTGIYNSEQDMSGKTVLITGATAGIGKVTAMDMARRNARVILACRNMGKANRVTAEIKSVTENQNVFVKCLDLSSFQSVRECAESVLKTEGRLDVLINNAGIMGENRRRTADGCEMIMQSNYLGHFLLTLLLLDLIKRSSPSRIINVSSFGHEYAKLDIEDINKEMFYFTNYANSKLANILFTRELAEILKGTGVTVNSLCPGAVRTDIMNPFRVILLNLIIDLGFNIFAKTPEEGAQTTIRLAVDPSLEKTTGKYFRHCKEAPTSKTAEDTGLAKRLFKLSEQIVVEKFPTM